MLINALRVCFSLVAPLALPLAAQHDPGRGAVRKLAKGDVEGALQEVEQAPKKSNSPIDEAEKHFVKLMVACQQNKPQDGFELAKKAVANGLPISRLQAGPRELLKVLHDHAPYQKWMAVQPALRVPGLVHGPMLGSVTDTSASIWMRTAQEAEVQVSISLKPANPQTKPEKIKEVIIKTSAAKDYTGVCKVEGLMPGREYFYTVVVKDRLPEAGVYQAFPLRTFPKQGKASKFHFAFGGCAGYTPKYEKMWSLIADHKPLALLMLGDNVYIDDPEHQLTNDYCYYRRHSQPDWSKLVAGTAVSAIYDDHDFGLNDCSGGPAIEKPAWKRAVFDTFRNNWVNHSYGGGDEQPGVWHDYYIGDVHFILLDCRYYRDRPGGTMIGPVQKAWLKETLKKSKGTFKMLCSSVPWSPGVKPGSKDTWDGFNDEREEIFGFIQDNKIEGVVLMAADRHRVDYRKTLRPKGYDLYEMMSARLTNLHTHGLVENAEGSEFIMGHNKTPAFAKVEIDTTLDDPTLTYRIITIENEEVGKAELKLSELKFEK